MQRALMGGAQEMMVAFTATLVGIGPRMALWDTPFRFNNAQEADAVLDGRVGQKMMQNEVFLSSFEALGANAIALPFSALFSALGTKTVDGQENPFNPILSSTFYEVQKYLSVTNHVDSPWIVLVSKKWWDGLSADEHKVLLDAAVQARDVERKDTRAEAAKALADLKGKGMRINTLSPVEAGRMRDKLASINAGLAASVGQPLGDETQAEPARLPAK